MTGRRVLLSKPIEGDRTGLERLWTDPLVRQFLGGPADRQRAGDVANAIILWAEEAEQWCVRLRSTDAFVGLFSISDHHDGEDKEVSFQMLPEFQGKGLASEALTLLLDRASQELRLPRIVAETQSANFRSCRLLERSGFVRERELMRFGAKQALYIKSFF